MLDNAAFRATVVYADSATGEIRVRIPSLGGLRDTVPISFIGRTSYNGVWNVPEIGTQIVVTASDDYLNNVYWVQVDPTRYDDSAVQTSIQEVQASVEETRNLIDALMLGIFS